MSNPKFHLAGLLGGNLAVVAAYLVFFDFAEEPRALVPTGVLRGHQHGVRAIAFSPDGKTLAVGDGVPGQAGEVKLWDLAGGQACTILKDCCNGVETVGFSPDGCVLATAWCDGRVRLWNLTTEREGATFGREGERVDVLAFWADGKSLLAANGTEVVWTWDVSTGRHQAGFISARGAKAIFAAGRTLATGHLTDFTISVRDLSTGQSCCGPPLHLNPVFCLAFSGDGRFLASGDAGGMIYVWDAATLRVQTALTGHRGPVNALAFAPDGRMLASGGHDKIVRLWDVTTGAEKARGIGHECALAALAFAPDGRTLAAGGYDKTVRLWQIAPGGER
jgi:WD40 repeat protein